MNLSNYGFVPLTLCKVNSADAESVQFPLRRTPRKGRIIEVNDGEIKRRVHSAMYHQLQEKGYAAPADVLMDIGVLTKEDYENWRFGRVPYLECVCKVNLKMLSSIMHEVRSYAAKNNLKPSWTYYGKWGVKNGRRPKLRFSKSGDEKIEEGYSTHYLKQQ